MTNMRTFGVVGLGFVFGLSLAVGGPSHAATTTGLRPGDPLPAPSAVLQAVDRGESKSLDAWVKDKGRTVSVVAFLSCRCPYVAQARASIAALAKKYAPRAGFIGINANQNEPVDDIKSDAVANYPFPMVRDEGSAVADAFGAERTPEIFVFDAGGRLRYHGGVADLEPALTALLAGKPVAKPESKAFGCTIKRKP